MLGLRRRFGTGVADAGEIWISASFAELVWMGSDSSLAAVQKLLIAAGIKFSERPPDDHLLIAAAFRATQIYVSWNDLARATLH